MKTKSVGLIPTTTIGRIRDILFSTAISALAICAFATAALAAGPDEWPATFYYASESIAQPMGEGQMQPQSLTGSALACKPAIQVSLNEEGYARITPSMMLYALDYPEYEYEVITDTGDDTVTCANIGQTLMSTIEELPRKLLLHTNY